MANTPLAERIDAELPEKRSYRPSQGISNLVLFTQQFPFGKGETFLETEIDYLASRFSRTIVVPFRAKPGERRDLPANVQLLPAIISPEEAENPLRLLQAGCLNTAPVLPFLRRFVDRCALRSQSNFLTYLKGTVYSRLTYEYIRAQNLIGSGETSIFYYYWGTGAAYVSPLISSSLVVQIARFHQGDLYENHPGGYFPFRKSELAALSFALPISDDGLDYLRSSYPDVRFEAKVFRLGVKPGRQPTRRQTEELCLISCSSVIPRKRVDLIYKSIIESGLSVTWTHIGDGSGFEELKGALRSSPAHVTVNLLGHVSNSDVMKHYSENRYDAFMSLASSEGVPVAIMEALSCGIPIVATDAGGTRELVDDSVGRLINNEARVSDVVAALRALSALSHEDQKRLRENARRKWRSLCDADRNYSEFCDFLESIHSS